MTPNEFAPGLPAKKIVVTADPATAAILRAVRRGLIAGQREIDLRS